MASYAARIAVFRDGLKDLGFVEGESVKIEYLSGEGQPDRLPALVSDLILRRVAVIFATGSSTPARLAKAQTTTIPIVFAMGGDPVEIGLVSSLNRPEANVTGVSFNSNALVAKRVELLREMLPGATVLGFITNAGLTISTPSDVKNVLEAAQSLGRQVHVRNAGSDKEIETAFASFAHERVAALMVAPDPFFISRRELLAGLAARFGLPAIYTAREFAEEGGLMSYAADVKQGYRQAGIYTGRILKGERPTDLPVQLPTKFELVINLKTAKTLGLEISPRLLALADEVIE
jgi:putative ABC transport system substrate-binding protein